MKPGDTIQLIKTPGKWEYRGHVDHIAVIRHPRTGAHHITTLNAIIDPSHQLGLPIPEDT